MGKAARGMRRRAGVEERKMQVKKLRVMQRAQRVASRVVPGAGGPRVLGGRRPMPQPPRTPRQARVLMETIRDRLIAEGSVVVGPDGVEQPLLGVRSPEPPVLLVAEPPPKDPVPPIVMVAGPPEAGKKPDA